MKRLAILDDDSELCELLQTFLTAEGFQVKLFLHPNDFLMILDTKPAGQPFDLLILDVMLPVINGFDVLKKIRAVSQMPVIMLTARGEEIDRIVGLELGADDYLPKPFLPRELAARIRAVLRRATPPATAVGALLPTTANDIHAVLDTINGAGFATSVAAPMLEVGALRLFPAARRAMWNEAELHLTAVEFRLLEVLMRSAGTVVQRQELALQVLDRRLSYDDRSLDVHVSNLRRKLSEFAGEAGYKIETVRGVGYVMPKALEYNACDD